MDNVFLDMVKETLTNNGIDITDMTDEEIVAKFRELETKDEEVKNDVIEQVAEKAQEGTSEEDEEEPCAENPTKLI